MDNDDKQWRRPPAWKLEEEIRDRVIDKINTNLGRRRSCRSGYGGLIPGAVVLAVGMVFLLDSLGYVSARHFIQFWPVVLIVIGLAKIFRPESRFWGAMFLVFGVCLQLDNLEILHLSWGQLWPLFLIAAGAMAMWSAIQARTIMNQGPQDTSDPRTTLNESAVFGGIEKRLNSREFRGGQLHAMFGGIEVDLRDAELAENEAVIYANAVFGGIELRVPEAWHVAARGQGIFGGFSDSTRYSPPTDPDKPKKTLVVLGTALFGGVEIHN
jgi:predicted membrane protein